MINEDISTLKGIGPKKKELFNQIGIETLEDLIHHYPRAYEDRRTITKIIDLKEDNKVLVYCQVHSIITKGKNSKVTRLIVSDETGKLDVVFFNMRFLEKSIRRGNFYYFYGVFKANGTKFELKQPEIIPIKDKEFEVGLVLPIYSTTKGLSQKELRKYIRMVLSHKDYGVEYLPQYIIEKNKLCSLNFAMENIHFPQGGEHFKVAKFRAVYEELFLMQLGLNMMQKSEKAGKIILSDYSNYLDSLPFELTKAQLNVVKEIQSDLQSGRVMNRLCQGDVGSGKTVVAELALYMCVKSGFQGAFMAPTDLLARQHYDGLKESYSKFGINVELLSGKMKAKNKKEVLKRLKCGEIDIIIGTHALIQPNVEFSDLGLVITDEQHRFGVNQRMQLQSKGENAHVLVMTATPIPRTLAVVLYGDLDVSIIDAMPKGRKKIVTKVYNEKMRNQAYISAISEIEKGRQCYVVTPLIDDSDEIEAKSVISVYNELVNKYANISIGLLHGQMKKEEKEFIMSEFKEGRIQLLVSTVVIEVGINVKNASCMIIENSERFGLAQLHQLRGRVGRGSQQSYCFLINSGKGDIAKKRGEIMESSNDGFLISEKDLSLRGPGEMFGTRQHGLPDLKMADLIRHLDILEGLKEDAKNVSKNMSMGLRKRVENSFGNKININI